MKTNFLVIGCLSLVMAVLVLVFVFRISFNSLLPWGVFLLCPLMHIWMMRDGGHKH